MDREIIEKVLSKTATPEEARQVAEWFGTDEGQAYFSQRYEIDAYLLNDELADEWLEGHTPKATIKSKLVDQLKVRLRIFKFRVIAAALIPVLITLSCLYFVVNQLGVTGSNDILIVSAPIGEQLNIVLQDGSRIQLNSGSQLHYPKSFGLFSRKVKLVGEGYFSIEKDKKRPFILDLKDLHVMVTGTKFNVKAYKEDHTVTLLLEEGGINIQDLKDSTYTVLPGQSAVFDKTTRNCIISQAPTPELFTSWRSKTLNFYRTPLKEILKTLERQHEVTFTVPDTSILNYKFSISTTKVGLEQILMDLEKVSRIQFELTEGDKYTVRSK